MKHHQAYSITFFISGTLMFLPAMAHADKAGDVLLKKCEVAMLKAKTLQADYSFQLQPDPDGFSHHGIIKLKKPRFTLEKHPVIQNGKTEFHLILEKGDLQYVYNPKNPQHTVGRFRSPDWAWRNDWTFGNAFGAFYDKDALYVYAPPGTVRTVTGTIRIGDTTCKVLTISKNPDYITVRYYIAPDGTLRGHYFKSRLDGQVLTSEARLTNVKVNAPIPDKVFEWTTPTGAKETIHR
jgi:hypothetical protein